MWILGCEENVGNPACTVETKKVSEKDCIMDSNKNNNEIPSPTLQPNALFSDEIDLLDILRILLHQKWLMCGIILSCSVFALGYSLLLPQEYQTEAITIPPTQENTDQLNVFDVSYDDTNQPDPSYIYQKFIGNLTRFGIQHDFFIEQNLAAFFEKQNDNRNVETLFNNEFSKKLSVKQGKDNADGEIKSVSISLEGAYPEKIAEWLNLFIAFVDRKTVEEHIQVLKSKVNRKEENILTEIKMLRAVEAKHRLDTIHRLEEAVLVAEKFAWVQDAGKTWRLDENVRQNVPKLTFSLQETPLFLRGTKVLRAEIDVLKKRKNDDPFIPGIRYQQERLKLLSFVSPETERVHAMRLGRSAIENNMPVKPKRKIIIVVGFVLGVFLSVLVALFRGLLVRDSSSECTIGISQN